MTVDIRSEELEEVLEVRAINEAAFEGSEEADLVDALRASCPEGFSLVAEVNDTLVGHLCFSTVTIKGADPTLVGMALAPMAVVPEHQRKGIGSELVKEGIAELKVRCCPFIVVLGHPEFYPRFGFVLASRHGLRCSWDVPDEVYMVLVLDEKRMAGVSGLVEYLPAFDGLS